MANADESTVNLVRRAVAGDNAAFATLAERERPSLVALGRRWFGDSYLAEETAQEALIHAFTGIGGLQNPAAFGGWLRTIARNLAWRRMRAQRQAEAASPEADQAAALASDPAESISLQDALRRAWDVLPPMQQAVATLCLAEDYSVAEAAARLAVPPMAVKGRLQRARETLREELSEIMPKQRETVATPPVSRPPTVLVVDDEHHIARLIQVNLEVCGYQVVTAANGAEALEQLEKPLPDLMTLDLLMPYRDGWDVLRTIRSRPDGLTLPIVVLSAVAADDPRNRMCHELADIYIQKPFSPPELIAWIDRRLGHLTETQRQDIARWRQLRFGNELTADAAAAYLSAEHYPQVRKEAYGVLAEMGADAIPTLAAVAAGDEAGGCGYAMQVLGRRPERAATQALVGLLSHADRQRRWEALCTIGAMSGEGALTAIVDDGQAVIDEIVAALDSGDYALQREAITALRRVKTPEALRALRAFAERETGGLKETVQAALRWIDLA